LHTSNACAVGAGDAAASPSKFFWLNLDKIWANEAKFGQIWAKVINIWENLIRFGQNQNLVSSKTFNLRLCIQEKLLEYVWICGCKVYEQKKSV